MRFRWPGQHTDIIDIDELEVGAGEHLFVRGSSGSGKTTLLNLLAIDGADTELATAGYTLFGGQTGVYEWQ